MNPQKMLQEWVVGNKKKVVDHIVGLGNDTNPAIQTTLAHKAVCGGFKPVGKKI